MTIIHDITCFLVLFESGKYPLTEDGQYVTYTMKDAADHAVELLGDFGGETQIIEFNIVEGYSRDVSEDACKLSEHLEYDCRMEFIRDPESRRGYVDPNKEHRLTKSQLGV
jgi:hypothetical protein